MKQLIKGEAPMTADISQENVAQRAQALLDRHALFEQGKESMVLSVSEAVDFALHLGRRLIFVWPAKP